MSRRLLLSIVRPSPLHFTALNPSRDRPTIVALQRRAPRLSIRNASTAIPPKTIVLEKPDKFRPPSHPQRLNRKPPRQYPGPPLSESERQAQKTRRYPHMFPNEGTPLHWFLTNKWIHMWISLARLQCSRPSFVAKARCQRSSRHLPSEIRLLTTTVTAQGTLTLLAIITLTQSFLLTSPFAHLIPPISSLPLHPVNYVSEWVSTIRLHVDYNSQKTAESRREGVLDAQKRRLFRRAHGMEDLDSEEEQGIDVRGLVEWDDGLTNKERREGGRRQRRTGKDVLEEGGSVGDPIDSGSPRARDVSLAKQNDGLGTGNAVIEGMKRAPEGSAEQEHAELKERFDEEPQLRRKVKRWFGIWE